MCLNEKEMSQKILEFLALFVVVLGREIPNVPAAGFRFNCWNDLCTFPTQYCDLDEKRCQYCSDDLCKSGKYPKQCLSYCASLLPTSTANVSTSSTSSPSPNSNAETNVSVDLPLWMTFAGVCIIILILIVLMIVFLCRKRKTIRRDDSFTKKGHQLRHPADYGLCHLGNANASQSTKFGGTQDSPTGQRGPSENQGDYKFLPQNINNSDSSINSYATTPLSTQETGIALKPTVSGDKGPSHKPFDCSLLDEAQRQQCTRIVTEEQQSSGSCDSGYRDDNSTPSNRNTNQKTIQGGATPENCPLLWQHTHEPTDETTSKTTYCEPVGN